ncbi:MAG: FG-GAP repeat domain-containing protein, partial [Thermoplasmatota archaeon]
MNRRKQRGAAPRGLAAVAALAIMASAILVAMPTAEAATTRSLAITSASSGSPTTFKAFDGNPPKTFDIDGDGRQEILAQNDNDNLYVFHSGTGKLLATLKSTYPAGWGARTLNGPEAYSQDGVSHIVQMNSAAYLTSWRFDAAASTATSFVFVKEWERRQTDCFAGPGSDSKPVLADLDRDGKLEILVSTEESGIYALRNTGQLYWKKCIGGGNGEPRSVDLNLDGWLDVVFASDGGVVTAMQGRPSGSCTPAPCPNTMWGFSIKGRYNLSSASVPVGAGIGQLDGLAGPDIVVGARDSHDAVNWTNDHALLLALSSTGQVLWAQQDLVDGNPLTYTHPMVVDADGDGRNEVYWGDWNTI